MAPPPQVLMWAGPWAWGVTGRRRCAAPRRGSSSPGRRRGRSPASSSTSSPRRRARWWRPTPRTRSAAWAGQSRAGRSAGSPRPGSTWVSSGTPPPPPTGPRENHAPNDDHTPIDLPGPSLNVHFNLDQIDPDLSILCSVVQDLLIRLKGTQLDHSDPDITFQDKQLNPSDGIRIIPV